MDVNDFGPSGDSLFAGIKIDITLDVLIPGPYNYEMKVTSKGDTTIASFFDSIDLFSGEQNLILSVPGDSIYNRGIDGPYLMKNFNICFSEDPSVYYYAGFLDSTKYYDTEWFTIQHFINQASDGDTILVPPGTYYENIDFSGKNIILASYFLTTQDTSYISQTKIFGRLNEPVISISKHESEMAQLTGFSICGGTSFDGGGIYCKYSQPLINYCIISGNIVINDGGGIYCEYSDPFISNCIISGNIADTHNGGGIYCFSSSPTIENCTIADNISFWYGGGIYCYYYSSPKISNCKITGNTAEYYSGGGLYFYYESIPEVSHCVITGNKASKGGGIYSSTTSNLRPKILNCIISENSAIGIFSMGGGIHCWNSSPDFQNTVISKNTAEIGGGLYCTSEASPRMLNCILWQDFPDEIFIDSGIPIIKYSDIQGGWVGQGNLNEKPMFIKFKDFDFLLSPNSPCVDSGDPRIHDKLYDWHPKWPKGYENSEISDMGAYGGPENDKWLIR